LGGFETLGAALGGDGRRQVGQLLGLQREELVAGLGSLQRSAQRPQAPLSGPFMG
jgi:hypothetical protein